MHIEAYSGRARTADDRHTFIVRVCVCACLLLLCALAQATAEVFEWRESGRAKYMRDFWNYIEGMIILLSVVVFALLIYAIFRVEPFGDALSACRTTSLAAIETACPGSSQLAALSPCRTQLLFAEGELYYDIASLLGWLILLAGMHPIGIHATRRRGMVARNGLPFAPAGAYRHMPSPPGMHWIKYLELVPRLALPVHTITSTFLDLCALIIVISLLLLFFALAFMLFMGHTSVSFSTFGDSILSVWLLTLGNIEYLDLLFREGAPRTIRALLEEARASCARGGADGRRAARARERSGGRAGAPSAMAPGASGPRS